MTKIHFSALRFGVLSLFVVVGAACSPGGGSSHSSDDPAPGAVAGGGGGGIEGLDPFLDDLRVDSDDPGADMSRNALVRVVGNTIHVMWVDYRIGYPSVWYRRSRDGGATWAAPEIQLGWITTTWNPVMAVSGANVYGAWTKDLGGKTEVYFSRSLNGGAAWFEDDVKISASPSWYAVSPQIACDGLKVYVIWRGYTPSGDSAILMNASSDGGATWFDEEVRIDTADVAASAPTVACIDSTVHVAWVDWRNGNQDIYYSRSTDGGVNWLSNDVRLDTDAAGTGWSSGPRIAATANRVYVIWSDGRDGNRDVYLNTSANEGGTWLAADQRIDTDAPGAAESYLAVLAAEGESVHVTWMDTRNGQTDIYYNGSTDGGATFQAEDLVLNQVYVGQLPSATPRIAMSGADVYVTWADSLYSYMNMDILLTHSADAGQTWLAENVRMDNDEPGAARSIYPDLSIVDGKAFVVWEDYRNGEKPDIYLRSWKP